MTMIDPMLQLSQFIENGKCAIYKFIVSMRVREYFLCYTCTLRQHST